MNMLKRAEVSRRVCPLIFLLDTSGSMDGQPIGAVNAAIEGIIPELISMNESNSDVKIEMSILSFNSSVCWITGSDNLVKPEDYAWNDLNAGGGTNLGLAIKELNKKLSTSQGFMRSATGSVSPVLFLLSDGEPTEEYKTDLVKLKDNPWYKHAIKAAVGYGDANDNVLAEFTGNLETVLHTSNPNDLRKMIQFVSITASMIASKSNPSGISAKNNNLVSIEDKTDELAEAIKAGPSDLLKADPGEDW